MSIEKGNIEADWKRKYESDDLQKPWINYLVDDQVHRPKMALK